MYTKLGYIVYRTIIDYYSGDKEEDAYGKWTLSKHRFLYNTSPKLYSKYLIPDMRKAMSRDKDKKSMIPLKHPVHCEEEF